jgi:hypothetical protein
MKVAFTAWMHLSCLFAQVTHGCLVEHSMVATMLSLWPAPQAEAAAIEACYVVQSVAQSLWTCLPDRTKDYIAFPKANGYK